MSDSLSSWSADPAAEALADDLVGLLGGGAARHPPALVAKRGGGGPDDPGVDGNPARGGGVLDEALEVGGQQQVDADYGGVVTLGDGKPHRGGASRGLGGRPDRDGRRR